MSIKKDCKITIDKIWMNKPKLTIIIPAYNEINTIQNKCHHLHEQKQLDHHKLI